MKHYFLFLVGLQALKKPLQPLSFDYKNLLLRSNQIVIATLFWLALGACAPTPQLLEPTGQNKISIQQANANLQKKPKPVPAPLTLELEPLQQELNSLKQLLHQLQTGRQTPTTEISQQKAISHLVIKANSPQASTETKLSGHSNINQVAALTSEPSSSVTKVTEKTVVAPPAKAQLLQIQADARLLAFHVLASDKTVINTLRRWANQEQWTVKLNGELVDSRHFPAHTVAYTDFTHGDNINSIGGPTLLLAVANLMQQHKQYQHQFQLEIQLRKAESQMVLTALPSPNKLNVQSVAGISQASHFNQNTNSMPHPSTSISASPSP